MSFKKGLTPPVDGFWSLTMYDGNYFFVENPLNRYSISARQPLKANADGSLTSTSRTKLARPGQGSQLAARAKRQVLLMMRLYWPKESDPSIINGSWKIPPVTKAS